MVLLEGRHVVRPAFDQGCRYRPLSAHGVQADHTAGDVYQAQYLRDGGHLVALGGHRRVGQAHALSGGPHAHSLHGGLPPPVRGGAPQLLAVNDQVPTRQQAHDVLPPLGEAAFEFDGVQVPKHG